MVRAIFGLLLLVGKKEFVKCPVHPGKLAQLLGAYKVHGIESGIQYFQPSQIAMIV